MSGAPFLPSGAALARLKKQQGFWGDIYDGSIVDLIAAGLVLPSQVPGIPGNRKTQATYTAEGLLCQQGGNRRYAITIRLTSKGRAQVCIPADEDEVARREQARKQQAERERLASCAKAKLAGIPQTHKAFKKQTEGFARSVLNALLVSIGQTDDHGFSYDDAAGDRIQELCVEILSIVAGGTTLLDRVRQSGACDAQQSTIASADGQFVRMLHSIVSEVGSQNAQATSRS